MPIKKHLMLHHIANYTNKIIDHIFSDSFDTTRGTVLALIGGMSVYTFSPMAITALKVAGGLMMALASAMMGNIGKDVYQTCKKKFGWFKGLDNKES